MQCLARGKSGPVGRVGSRGPPPALRTQKQPCARPGRALKLLDTSEGFECVPSSRGHPAPTWGARDTRRCCGLSSPRQDPCLVGGLKEVDALLRGGGLGNTQRGQPSRL